MPTKLDHEDYIWLKDNFGIIQRVELVQHDDSWYLIVDENAYFVECKDSPEGYGFKYFSVFPQQLKVLVVASDTNFFGGEDYVDVKYSEDAWPTFSITHNRESRVICSLCGRCWVGRQIKKAHSCTSHLLNEEVVGKATSTLRKSKKARNNEELEVFKLLQENNRMLEQITNKLDVVTILPKVEETACHKEQQLIKELQEVLPARDDRIAKLEEELAKSKENEEGLQQLLAKHKAHLKLWTERAGK